MLVYFETILLIHIHVILTFFHKISRVSTLALTKNYLFVLIWKKFSKRYTILFISNSVINNITQIVKKINENYTSYILRGN